MTVSITMLIILQHIRTYFFSSEHITILAHAHVPYFYLNDNLMAIIALLIRIQPVKLYGDFGQTLYLFK